jgi:AraC family transcriptional regulator
MAKMAQPQIILESNYTLELRTFTQRANTLPPPNGFLLVYAVTSNFDSLMADSIVFINPPDAYELPRNRGRSELLLVRLTPQGLIETATRLKLHREAALLSFRQTHVVVDDARLQATLSALVNEWQTRAAGWREMLNSLVQQLTVHLLRQHINVKRSDDIELSRVGLVDRRLRRAIEFMHDHCGRELSLREIAEAAYVSEFHFARLFKKITGQTPHVYLASIRIEKARRLLAETDLPINEIGARVGYTSQSHFTKVFRAATGATPKAFRDAAQKIT